MDTSRLKRPVFLCKDGKDETTHLAGQGRTPSWTLLEEIPNLVPCLFRITNTLPTPFLQLVARIGYN